MSDEAIIGRLIEVVEKSMELHSKDRASFERVRIKLDEMLLKMPEFTDTVTAKLERMHAGSVKSRAEIMDRIDRVQNTIDLAREDIRVNWATANTAMGKVKNSQDDIDNLNTLIAAMERRFQVLSDIVDEMRKRDSAKP